MIFSYTLNMIYTHSVKPTIPTNVTPDSTYIDGDDDDDDILLWIVTCCEPLKRLHSVLVDRGARLDTRKLVPLD